MTQDCRQGWWKFRLVSVLIGGAIAASSDGCAFAQIAPDATLGAESSVVTPNNVGGIPGDVIQGGATRGANLFHSFEQFSVLTGRAALFNNAANIQNIVSRVTGGAVSNINGLIQANGKANVFLLNPNGIIFGPNAALNIGGSFLGSTANSIKFADGTSFSAAVTQATPLLTISVPIGLQFGNTAGNIVNQYQAINSNGALGLQVQPGKTLALVGGDVNLNGGILLAPGGRVELGGLAGTGTVKLNVDPNNLSLSYPENVQRADVSLTNGAGVGVVAGSGGSIAVNARNLNIIGGSRLVAGTEAGLGAVDSKAGNIEINASGIVSFDGGYASNNVASGAVGNGGNINITTGSLQLSNNAQLIANSQGQGNAGSVNIIAPNMITFDQGSAFSNVTSIGNSGGINITTGTLQLSNNAALSSSVFADAKGNSGGINITTGSLFVNNGAQLAASTEGQGNAGSVNINAPNMTTFDRGFAFSNVTSTGNTGGINITTGSLQLSNNAQLIANSQGQGKAGSVNIIAPNMITVDRGSVFSNVTSTGSSGGINITTGLLQLSNNAALSSSVFPNANGNSGGINITTGSLFVNNGAQLAASTEGQGDAGSLTINAPNMVVSFDRGFAFSNVTSTGNSGGINITSGSLQLSNNAQLIANSQGQGNAGSVNIIASNMITFDQGSAFSNVTSTGNSGGINITTGTLQLSNNAALSSSVFADAKGNSGGINVTTGSLFVNNGAQLAASTEGQGDAGSVNINAPNMVTFDQGSAFSNVTSIGSSGGINIITGTLQLSNNAALSSSVFADAKGNSGGINVTTGSLFVNNGAQLAASTEGQGDAGSVNINAPNMVTFDQGSAFSNVTSIGSSGGINIITGLLQLSNNAALSSSVFADAKGNSGGINITTRSLFVNNGAQLAASTEGQGNAGSVNINAPNMTTFDRGFAFSNVTSIGSSGGINIITGTLFVNNGAQLVASTEGQGDTGGVTINARDLVSFDRGFTFSNVTNTGNTGGINITTGSLKLSNGAQLSSNTNGQGNAGSVNINARDLVSFDGLTSSILATVDSTESAKGSNIDITTGSLFVTNGAQLIANTQGRGDAGSVNIHARDLVSFDGLKTQLLTTVASTAVGKGGNIDITTGSLKVTNGAQLNANTQGQGDAGGVTINARELVSFDGVGSDGSSSGVLSGVATGAVGKGGDIQVNTNAFRLANGAVLNTLTQANADTTVAPNALRGGTITVKANTFNVTNGSQLITTTEGTGLAGDIILKIANNITLSGQGSGLFANTAVGSTGNGGTITIDPNSVFINNGAGIAVNSLGTGNAGEISLVANSLTLDSRAFISADKLSSQGGNIVLQTQNLQLYNNSKITNNAQGQANGGSIIISPGNVRLENSQITSETASGLGGDIRLDAGNLLLLRRNSLISTTAGNNQNGGNGGNIDINTRFIVAVPTENSDISANAFTGNGGQVSIAATGIFGTQFREQPTPLSDITASSTGGGVNGSVNINIPVIDPTQGLVALPAQVVDPATQIAQGCAAGDGITGSQFLVTGRGGLPPNPGETLSSDVVWEDARLPATTANQHRSETVTAKPPSDTTVEIVPATGWVFNNKGEVTLTALAPNVTPYSPALTPSSCRGY